MFLSSVAIFSGSPLLKLDDLNMFLFVFKSLTIILKLLSSAVDCLYTENNFAQAIIFIIIFLPEQRL